MWTLLCLAQFLPCAVNFSFSACVAWCFHKYPRPPGWIVVILLIFGVGTIRLIFMGAFGYTITLLTVPTAILCIVHALALMLRRWFGTGWGKSWAIPLLVVLPVIIWGDLRFSVLVVDKNGNPVEVVTRQIEMQAMPRSIFYYGYGNRLKTGVVYFGFCQWVMHRDNWVIYGRATPLNGDSFPSKSISCKANWVNWPLRITVDAKAP